MVEGPDTTKSNDIQAVKNEVPKKKGKEEKLPTKILIRKLPGNMTEDTFLECVAPLFEHDYFYFVQNENPSFGEHNYSRAYINFINPEDVFTFTMKFDDYVFLDDTGQEYPALVEYAPFQRIPKNRNSRKTDSYSGTIEEDPDYQEFLSQLESEEQEHKPSNQITEHYFDLANDENEEKVTTTPLLEYLTSRKNEWIKYKEEKKEERRRREMERKKMKEESKRIKKESKEAVIRAKMTEKVAKEEKKKDTESKSAEESKPTVTSIRVRGKSYQEERQRDLARRKLEETTGKPDENKENKHTSAEGDEKSGETSAPEGSDTQTAKDGVDEKSSTSKSEHRKDEDNQLKRSSYRDEDRKTGTHSREKDDKKSYSYGSKKREYINGYEQDSKYRSSKGYYYDDYKTRGHSSFQKNAYVGGKYGKGKDYHEEKSFKRYESASKFKKYDQVEYKESKKTHYEKDSVKKSTSEKYAEKSSKKEQHIEEHKENENFINRSDADGGRNDESPESYADTDSSRSKSSKRDDRKDHDPRTERRIKNKDRPALEIYRPGMGKFSRQRLERNKSTESKDGD